MKAQRILYKAQTLVGLSYCMNTLIWDIENDEIDYRKKFHSIVEVAEVIYHKVLELKNDITKLAMQEENEELKEFLEA